jgi:hypothetical protein
MDNEAFVKAPFVAVNNSGYTMTFSNGWTVSVMWGAGNYASNRGKLYNEPRQHNGFGSQTAEIAAWHNDGRNWEFGPGYHYDGYRNPNEIADLISEIKNSH